MGGSEQPVSISDNSVVTRPGKIPCLMRLDVLPLHGVHGVVAYAWLVMATRAKAYSRGTGSLWFAALPQCVRPRACVKSVNGRGLIGGCVLLLNANTLEHALTLEEVLGGQLSADMPDMGLSCRELGAARQPPARGIACVWGPCAVPVLCCVLFELSVIQAFLVFQVVVYFTYLWVAKQTKSLITDSLESLALLKYYFHRGNAGVALRSYAGLCAQCLSSFGIRHLLLDMAVRLLQACRPLALHWRACRAYCRCSPVRLAAYARLRDPT